MQSFFTFIAVAGVLLAKLSILIGVGFFLYQWGVSGTAVGLAAWIGFKEWITYLGVGLISAVVGVIGVAAYD